jgi:hypothetical protein
MSPAGLIDGALTGAFEPFAVVAVAGATSAALDPEDGAATDGEPVVEPTAGVAGVGDIGGVATPDRTWLRSMMWPSRVVTVVEGLAGDGAGVACEPPWNIT